MGGKDDMVEKASDTGIDKAGDTADQKFAGHEGQVDKAQEAADKKIGR